MCVLQNIKDTTNNQSSVPISGKNKNVIIKSEKWYHPCSNYRDSTTGPPDAETYLITNSSNTNALEKTYGKRCYHFFSDKLNNTKFLIGHLIQRIFSITEL